MKFELNWLVAVTFIQGQPFKTKSSFPSVTYYYCFRTRAVVLPGWHYGHSPVNKPCPPPPPNAQPRHTWCTVAGHLISGFCKCDYLQDFKKESFSIRICNTFLELLHYFNSMMVCSFRLASCTGLWYSHCHILSSRSNKWPTPKRCPHCRP